MTLPSTNGSGRATIAAIAEDVGVSVATVSKVLNGRGDVASETRTRVEASLTRHSYRRRGGRRPPATGHIELVFHTLGADWAMEIIAIFGNRLTPRAGQAVSGLSYANRRRTEIARALASRPKLLLLDEPTAGMNPAETLELAEQIKGLKGLGLTVLLIEHKLDVVTRLADTVYVLDHGEVIAKGPPEEVRRNEDVLRAYLGRNAQAAAAGTTGPAHVA